MPNIKTKHNKPMQLLSFCEFILREAAGQNLLTLKVIYINGKYLNAE